LKALLQIANITKDRPELLHLLDEAYNDIYLPAFPDAKERESLEKIRAAVDGKFDKIQIVVNILGENLEDKENYVIKGLSIAYYYENQNVGLLAYNCIHPDHQEGGLGKLMVVSRIEALQECAKKNGKELAGVFIECNDPFKVSEDMDSMDPKKRVEVFKKWGARQVPIDYVQPPTSPDGYYCDTMILLNYPVDGKYADKETCEAFLRGIYRDFRTEQIQLGDEKISRTVHADDDHYFREMKKQLDAAVFANDNKAEEPGYKKGVPRFNFFK
jgi:hypothetical protein